MFVVKVHLEISQAFRPAKRQKTGALQDASRFLMVIVGAQRLGLRRPSAAFGLRRCQLEPAYFIFVRM
jgi:hypothetical protein